ncbi:MAG: 4-hydroxybenzoate octaprenyltransferase [Pseudomonadota bacterium]
MPDTHNERPITELEPAPSTAAPPPPHDPPSVPADAIPIPALENMPPDARAYLSLSRLDRPVGIWLLALPCWIGLAFARLPGGLQWSDIIWVALFGIGALVMRGAGCTWNDIQDREIDAKVARTAGRPLPSGAISLSNAFVWLGAQLFVGFLVWLVLPGFAKLIALAAIPFVAAYPFMKRITFWPQAWLGYTFNWGVLVAAATVGNLGLAAFLLFIGLALWTIAYDTIYAIQDREDDALIGVGSTARLFGKHAALGAFAFHLAAATLIAIAATMADAGNIGRLTALAFLVHGLWQVSRLKRSREQDALAIFKSNVWAGAILAGGFVLAGWA